QTSVSDAMRANITTLLFVSRDSSEGSRKKFSSNADRKNVPVLDCFGGAELGELVGRNFVGVLAITDVDLGARIEADARRVNDLSIDGG
ncbi:MAG: L7Ae/L30e/S12e/Gadd45 family ribosomal protein, partial [Bradymonadaceae bacterium]